MAERVQNKQVHAQGPVDRWHRCLEKTQFLVEIAEECQHDPVDKEQGQADINLIQ